jgi:hypothetical protein
MPYVKAALVLHTRFIDEEGAMVEMKVYKVPKTQTAPHGFKYSMVYVREGKRLLGYDNHERKGDHRHVKGETAPYRFTTVDQLIADFLKDMHALKGARRT